MHLDVNGLPIQSDGDAADQLQRTGFIAVGVALDGDMDVLPQTMFVNCMTALVANGLLQPTKGVFRRNASANPNTCSADQLIPVIAQRLLHNFRLDVRLFAQNTHTIEGKRKFLPDILFFRAAPMYFRRSLLRYIFDLLLILQALVAVGPVWRDDAGLARRSLDDVDDANGIITLAVCHELNPTFLSKLACRLYAWLRPTNYGVTKLGSPNNIQGALDWYNRPESGGNPEIAQLWAPVVKRIFYPRS